MPATAWVTAADNPFNLDAFMREYEKSITAATPGERSRDMAAALVAAGAMMHALGDLGVPARVRGDYAANFEHLGGGPDDLGSRFERIASLVYGRLGVPAPSTVITRTSVRAFFTAAPASGAALSATTPNPGLADVIARGYFSTGTLPQTSRITGGNTKPVLARTLPALPTRLNLMAASREDGTTLRDASGTCLARYRVDHGVLAFTIDDDCALEQITAILPTVAAYETGLLDFLFRGDLAMTIDNGAIVVAGKGLGDGMIELLVEDDRGVRTAIAPLASANTANAGARLAQVPLPKTGTRVVAMFHGKDAAGEPIIAVRHARAPALDQWRAAPIGRTSIACSRSSTTRCRAARSSRRRPRSCRPGCRRR